MRLRVSTSGPRSEIPGWLVREDDRGIHRQRPGDGDALTLAARQLLGQVLQAVAELDERQQLARSSTLCRGQPRRMQRRRRFQDTSVGAVKNWKMKPILSRRTRVRSSSPSCDSDAPSTRTSPEDARVEAADEVQERRLPRSGRPDDRHHLAPLDGQAHVVQRDDLTFSVEPFRDSFEHHHRDNFVGRPLSQGRLSLWRGNASTRRGRSVTRRYACGRRRGRRRGDRFRAGDARGKAAKRHVDGHAFAVERAAGSRAGARHAAADIGDAEAALPVVDDPRRRSVDLGIDDRHGLGSAPPSLRLSRRLEDATNRRTLSAPAARRARRRDTRPSCRACRRSALAGLDALIRRAPAAWLWRAAPDGPCARPSGST